VNLPEWWLEAAVSAAVFGLLLVVWVALPPRPEHVDFGARLRARITRMARRGR